MVYVVASLETQPEDSVCFTAEEFAYAERMANAFRDAEQASDFWQGIYENKKRDPRYSVYTAFPKVQSLPSVRPHVAEPPGGGWDLARRRSAEILAELRSRSQKVG